VNQAGTGSAALKAAAALARLSATRGRRLDTARDFRARLSTASVANAPKSDKYGRPSWPPTRETPPSAEFTEVPRRRSAVHIISLVLVWLAVASGGYVAFEPAPVDALTMGLVVLLPAVGLCAIGRSHIAYLVLWLVVMAAGFVAAAFADDVGTAVMHMVVSLYLCLASFVFAAFVARKPEAHASLVLDAYATAAVIVAIASMVGYLDLLPGIREHLTVHGRASAGFKDPNVFAAFLVPPLVYLLHRVLNAPAAKAILPAAGLAALLLALLVSFSRGAWVNAGVAVLAYGWLGLVTAGTDRHRVKLVLLGTFGAALAALMIAAALQVDAIAELFAQRASLDQGYDQGPEGRFGGQFKAWSHILDNPLGIGALQFGGILHAEQPHNVYLSMLLYTGWVGGFVYILLVGLTLAWGLSSILRRQYVSPLLLVVYAAFLGLIVEGFVIDTDHWRQFYLVMGLVWGLMLLVPRPEAVAPLAPARARRRLERLVSPARPRRNPRIVGRAPLAVPPGILMRAPPRRRRRTPKRNARILAVLH
jgi:hypothetical protein